MGDYLYKELNKSIREMGSGFGPALVNLILYGPLDHSKIDESNLHNLKTIREFNTQIYQGLILPKSSGIFKALTHPSVNFANGGKGIHTRFEITPFENVRNFVKNRFNNQFELDETTLNSLYSSQALKENNFVYFKLGKNLILSHRFKTEQSLTKKYLDTFKKNELCSKRALEFICTVASHAYDFWPSLEDYESEFGGVSSSKIGNYTDLMLGDSFGIKIIDTSQTRSDDNLERLVNLGNSIQIEGFKTVSQRFDDHRERTFDLRPGGLHYTLIDAGQTNFQIEVQVQGLKDIVFDKHGPSGHELYTQRNKKLLC